MSRPRSPNRARAFQLYKERDGQITSAEIAETLGEKLVNIQNWRVQDKWNKQLNKIGAPFGNSNAIGNKGGAAPEKNKNHYIHGLYSKYFPKQTVDIMKGSEDMDPIDLLWLQIRMKFAAIVRAQKIMYVKSQKDMTKELKKTKTQYEDGELVYQEEEYEIQFAWDKQATFLKAQSIAMGQLTSMIKRYDDMLNKDWAMVTEEQRLRVENLRQQLQDPELDYKKQLNDEKMKLSRERFEHQKKMDELKNF
jgi:phage terminase small subunit